DVRTLELLLPVDAFHPDVIPVDEGGNAVNHFDAVARELVLCHRGFGLDHLVAPEPQVEHADLVLDAVIDAVDALVLEAGEVQHGFPHRLARDRAGVDAHAAGSFPPFPPGYAPAALRRLNGGPLSGRPGADHDHVVGANNCFPLKRAGFTSR